MVRVSIADPNVEVTGMDCIWHNMYDGSNVTAIRKWFALGVNAMLVRVAEHVQMGLCSIISISASKHSFVVVCACHKDREEFPEDAFWG